MRALGAASFVALLPAAAAHGSLVDPPPLMFKFRNALAAGSCLMGECEWYENDTYIPGNATIPVGSPLKTMLNCRSCAGDPFNQPGSGVKTDGTNIGCLTQVGQKTGGGDCSVRHPWRAPGTAPITSPCGIDGGNPQGCPRGNPGIGNCATGGYGHGKDGRKLLSQGLQTDWQAGSAVEVKWGNNANHVGGYQYRLCKEPANEMDLTEECFQKTPLDFVGSKQWIEFTDITKPRLEFDAMDTRVGTWPPNSQWRRNPIPCGNYMTWRGGPLLGTMYPPPLGRHDLAGYGPFTAWSIVDKLQVPNLPAGAYVLSWRWDTEQYAQVWNSCSRIRITGGGPAPPATPPPAPQPPAPQPTVYKCVANACAPRVGGSDLAACEAMCGPAA